jgi:PKD repeat protein
MRSSRVLTLAAGVAFLAACGDSNGPSNNAPTAAFDDPTCTALACSFSGDASTDGDGTISTYSWNFGDPTSGAAANTATTKDADHAFSAAGTYTVQLTVTDNDGATGTVSKSVTVSVPAGSPTAAFTVSCSALDCTVIDASTDAAPGTITAWHWDFGDTQTADVQSPPAHHYDVDASTPFTVTLTVTDNDGLTGTATQTFNVSPAAGLVCNGQACTLDLPQASTVVVTLVSHDCEIHGNSFVLTAPVEETLFSDGCYDPVSPDPAASHPLNGGAAFDAGTQLAAEVRSGFTGTTSPQLQVTGDYATGWTLSYDDGFVGPGEPDFNDLIITVVATPSGP